MLIELAQHVVADAKAREAEGDCPSPGRYSAEQVEAALVTVAGALLAAEAERDRLKVERDELVSRAEVLRVLRRLGDQDADLALYGAEDNARAREYGEAAMTRARCAVAIMPSSAGMSEAELREAVRGSVGLGLDAEDAADEVIRGIFGERS